MSQLADLVKATVDGARASSASADRPSSATKDAFDPPAKPAIATNGTSTSPADSVPDSKSVSKSQSAPNSPALHSRVPSYTYGLSIDGLTPAARTGPPRTLSFNYARQSLSVRYDDNNPTIDELVAAEEEDEDDPTTYNYTPHGSGYRSALDYNDPEQRERERELAAERRGKRSSSSRWGEFRKWLPTDSSSNTPHASPTEEKTGFDFGRRASDDEPDPAASTSAAAAFTQLPLKSAPATTRRTFTTEPRRPKTGTGTTSSAPRPGRLWSGLRPTRSLPDVKNGDAAESAKDKGKSKQSADDDAAGAHLKGQSRWTRLRSLLPHVVPQAGGQQGASAVAPVNVNITDELMASGLSALLLRLWFEHDERGRRRIPVLLHRLSIHISDSLHPTHGAQSVFRIECEYANGALRWVIYRQLRDFLSLHTHYAVSNAYNRNVGTLPEFPKTSTCFHAYGFVRVC
jgi:phospholipase D1/2